jgi:hypothetical protein
MDNIGTCEYGNAARREGGPAAVGGASRAAAGGN